MANYKKIIKVAPWLQTGYGEPGSILLQVSREEILSQEMGCQDFLPVRMKCLILRYEFVQYWPSKKNNKIIIVGTES